MDMVEDFQTDGYGVILYNGGEVMEGNVLLVRRNINILRFFFCKVVRVYFFFKKYFKVFFKIKKGRGNSVTI